MKRYISILVLIFMQAVYAFSQNAADLFISMPDDISPALSKVNKEDMVDFKNSGMKAVVTDALDYKAEMTEMTSTFLSVNTSSAGNLQLKVLPLNDSTEIVCLVRTVCPEACLSNIRFFSTDWKELPAKQFFELPGISNFMKNPSKACLDSIAHTSISDIRLFKYDISPSENKITVTPTFDKYVTDEENVILSRLLSDKPVVMVWRNGHFEID